MTQGGLSKTFFYDEQDLLSDGVNTYLNGLGLDNPLRMSNGSTASYYLQNQIGSVTRLSNASGASVGHYQYLPYGGLLSSSAPVTGNPFTFTAREDDGTGLMYYRARYYDPALQVFISQDPLGDDQRYVGGNPTGFTDPLGLFILPNDPSGLPKDWKFDPSHRDPYGERYRNPHGDILDYHKPREGGKGSGSGRPWKEKQVVRENHLIRKPHRTSVWGIFYTLQPASMAGSYSLAF